MAVLNRVYVHCDMPMCDEKWSDGILYEATPEFGHIQDMLESAPVGWKIIRRPNRVLTYCPKHSEGVQ